MEENKIYHNCCYNLCRWHGIYKDVRARKIVYRFGAIIESLDFVIKHELTDLKGGEQ